MVLLLILGVLLIGATVVLVGRAVFLPRLRAAETVEHISAYGFRPTDFGEVELDRPQPRRVSTATNSLLERAARLPGSNIDEIRKQLFAAGMYTTSPVTFAGVRALATITLPILWLWLSISTGKSTVVVIFGLALAIFAGAALPTMLVKRRAAQRLQKIDYEMPDLIDTLVTTVEAGIAFAGSLQIAAQRFRGPLAEELRLLLQEQNMGLGIRDALLNLVDRADTPAVRSFVRSIIQGELLGVSVGESLRSLAKEMRQRRRAAAEERAQKAPVKMLFPLTLLIFPAMFIILLGPAAFKFHDLFSGS